ncbi:cholesterol 7-desaturase-like [Chelonus insularis]|uniref:cholesterol 7-desaturase-like n=1 Tax=Chelonus insularis TaxID=460826 RepID=UPI00158BAA3C|nr:cholesterol 7-desaturase-like [Chelonus insularis]
MIEWFISIILGLFLYYLYFWKINIYKNFNVDDERGNKPFLKRKIKELPPVFPNGWFGLLRSFELAKGEVKYVTALGEHFAVFRTETGVVNVIDAFCPHLGANFAKGGKVKGECIECPFHSWTFTGDGRCQNIPYSSRALSGLQVKHWISQEVNKIIFVWYHAESMDPDWQVEPIPQIENEDWIYQGRNQFIVNCHVQEVPENGSDWTHLDAVHVPAMFMDAIPSHLIRHAWDGTGWNPPKSSDDFFTKEFRNEDAAETNRSPSEPQESLNMIGIKNEKNVTTESLKHQATFNLIHSIKILNRFTFLRLNVNGAQIGPGYVVLHVESAFGPICILETVTPIEPLLQHITHTIYSPFYLSPYTKIVFYGMGNMFERDIFIWNHKIFMKNPILTKEEKRIAAFRRWFSQFYSPNSPTYKSVTSLEW